MKTAGLWVVSLFFFALLVSCSSEDKAADIACQGNGDCPVGQICNQGKCVNEGDLPDGDGSTDGDEPLLECYENFDCDPGLICRNGHCVLPGQPDGDTDPDGDADGDTDGDDAPDGDTDGDADGDAEGEEESGDPCLSNADCDDGNYCNGAETCGANGWCVPGVSPCADSVDCTDETCDEEMDQCAIIPNHAACQDTDPCNGDEICDETQGCIAGTPPECADELDCTDDSCVEGTGCVFQPVHDRCDDGNDCTADECRPDMGGCVNQPDDAYCNDQIDCTDDVCDAYGGCQHVAVDAHCSDEISCTVDICNPASGCENTPSDTFCDDQVDCTDDACDPAASALPSGCTFTVNHANCDDGHACTDDTCQAEYGCQYETHDDRCDDGVGCTVDTCQTAAGCVFSPDNDACSPQICDPTAGCVDPPECTEDAHCTDHNPCNGVETCVAEVCTPGLPPDCSDGLSCTVDSCDPTNEAAPCVHTPNHAACDDSDDCTDDVCDTTDGCVYTVDKDSDNDYYLDKLCAAAHDCPNCTDCNDDDPDVHPGQDEICEDTVDNNCDGLTDLEDVICQPCAGTCPTGMSCCGSQCIDTQYDNNNCGGCNAYCSTACFKGECLPAGKCATALRNLITGNVEYNNRDTCGAGDHFDPTGCDVDGGGEDHIYAIKAIDGNQMQMTMYPDGSDGVEYEVMYFLSDCRDMGSCFSSQDYGNYISLEIPEDNGGQIFFAVTDFRNGHCGEYDFEVDYDYDGGCDQFLAPPGSRPLDLAVILLWLVPAAFIFVRERRRRA